MSLKPGHVVDRYTVESVLGKGGMAIVYKVRHAQLGSAHALKVLTMTSESIRERLLQEGRVQASLAHPNIVAVTDILDVGGSPGLVMEYITGASLDDYLGEHVPDAAEAERLFRGIVEGVRHAHALGVIHRDLKPANVMLYTGAGAAIPKVADFGLAKAFAEEGSMGQTRSGVAMGTPAYMSPEQIRDAKNVDERADVFSLGCILYELLAGKPPFAGPDILSIFNAVTSGDYPPLERVVEGAPDHLRSCIEGCLQVDRDRRLTSCADIVRVLNGEPWQMIVAPAVPTGATLSGEDFVTGEVPRSFATANPQGLVQAELARGKQMVRVSPTLAPDSIGAVDGSVAPRPRPSSPSMVSSRVAVAGVGGVLALGAGAVVLLAALGAGGWWWVQSSTDAAVRTFLSRVSGDDIEVRAVRWSPGAVILDGVRVKGSDGQPLASVREVRMVGDLSAERFALDELVVDGVQFDLRRDASGWVVPVGLQAAALGELAHQSAKAQLLAHRVVVDDIMVKYRGASQETSARAQHLQLDELRLDTSAAEGWRAARFSLDGLTVQDVQQVLRVEHLVVPEAGVATAEGVELHLQLAKGGLVAWPEPAQWEIARWAGGVRASELPDPWFGWDVRHLPAMPASVRARGVSVSLVDAVNGGASKTWSAALDGIDLGPADAERLPFSMKGKLAGAEVDAHGDLREDGLLRVQGSVHALSLTEMSPYFRTSEAEYGATLEGGATTLDVAWSNLGTTYAVALDGSVSALSFAEAPGGKGGNATRRLLRDTASHRVHWEDDGDLDAADSAPLNGVLEQIADAAFDGAGGAKWMTGPAVPRNRRTTAAPAPTAPVTPTVAPTPTTGGVAQGGGVQRTPQTPTEPRSTPTSNGGVARKPTADAAQNAVRAAREVLQSGGLSRPR